MIRLPIEEILAADPAFPAGEANLLGRSRGGRAIRGYRLGSGPLAVSLIGGCHADEPVGPAMLDRLVAWLARSPREPLLERATLSIVPHVNPDGDAANAGWSALPEPAAGYDLAAYLDNVVREAPGDDVEFGFPRDKDDSDARPENRAVATFLAESAPFALHVTFHGMAFAAGPWFLIERGWIERTKSMRDALRRRVADLGYRLHDVDRGGEKGFTRIDEGFTTRPDSGAMRAFFLERGDPETAALFRPSSMEHVRSLGGDPLTMVSEMPLFLYPGEGPSGQRAQRDDPPLPTRPEATRAFVAWAQRTLRAEGADALRREADRLGLRPMPIGDQMRLQLAMLGEGLAATEGKVLQDPP